MFTLKVKLTLIFAALVSYTTAFPRGAPANICGRYVPGGHRNSGTPVNMGPQTGPFAVDVTPAGTGLYTVTLRSTSGQPFKGFVIQALPTVKSLPDGPSDIVGSFQQDFAMGTSQVRSCGRPGGSNVLTHTSADPKTQFQANWQVPINNPYPSVKFMATVVRDFDNFYVVNSNPVDVSGGTSGSGTAFGTGSSASFGTTGQGMSTGGMGFETSATGNNFMNTGGMGFETSGTGNSFMNTEIMGFETSATGNNFMNTGSTGFETSRNSFMNTDDQTGSTMFGDLTGAKSVNQLGGGIPVIPDAPQPIQLFNPFELPPIVLPNGRISAHSQISDQVDNSVAIPGPEIPGTVSPLVSSSTETLSALSLDSASSLSSASDTADSMVTITMDSVVLPRPPNGFISGSSVSSSIPSLGFVDLSVSADDNFGTTNLLNDAPLNTEAPLAVNIEIPPQSPNDPTIQIIEIPILPEGQTAAVLNISGRVPSIPLGQPPVNETPQIIQTRTGNILRLDVGSAQGQGQSGFGQGQNMPSSNFGGQFGGNQFGGRPGMATGSGMFGTPGGSPFGGAGFPGRSMGPFGGARSGQFGGPGGPGSMFGGGSTFGGAGQGAMGQFGGQGQNQFGGQSMFGGPGTPFGSGQTGGFGQGGAMGPFGGSGAMGMGGPGMFGGAPAGRFGGMDGGFGGAGRFPGQGGTPFGAGGAPGFGGFGAAGQPGMPGGAGMFGGPGGMTGGQTFGTFPQGPAGTSGFGQGQSGFQQGASGTFGSSFGGGASQGAGSPGGFIGASFGPGISQPGFSGASGAQGTGGISSGGVPDLNVATGGSQTFGAGSQGSSGGVGSFSFSG